MLSLGGQGTRAGLKILIVDTLTGFYARNQGLPSRFQNGPSGGQKTGRLSARPSLPSGAISVGTAPMIAIPVAANLGSVAMIVGQTPHIPCNDRGHGPPSIAIPAADDCDPLHVTAPLYHYTDARGLEGIISTQQIWLTHYRHLNDPSELEFGMTIARKVLAEVGESYGPKVKIFCDMVADLFSSDNMQSVFDIYVGSFSQESDDLRQWQVYAGNGRGFALGLAPHLFAVEEMKPDQKPHENLFVAPVYYGEDAGRLHHLPAIESAARIVAETVGRKAKLMRDANKGMPFFDEMGKCLIAAELLLNSLTLKHGAYGHEREVRLFNVGEIAKLAPYVSTRTRGSETVPFIKSGAPIQKPGSVAEIVVGPSAPADAEDFACALLKPFHDNPESIVRRSVIPYRAF